MADDNPQVIVLAGPNGSGKTTSSRTILAETLRVMTFVNADWPTAGGCMITRRGSAHD